MFLNCLTLFISNYLKIARCLKIIFQIWKAIQNVFKKKTLSRINNFTKMFVKFILAPAGPPPIKPWVRPCLQISLNTRIRVFRFHNIEYNAIGNTLICNKLTLNWNNSEEGRAARRYERRIAQEVLCAAAEARREERGERRDERSARREARPRRRRSRETRETRCGCCSRRDETRAAAAAAREREHAEKKSRVQREEQEREREKESEPCA